MTMYKHLHGGASGRSTTLRGLAFPLIVVPVGCLNWSLCSQSQLNAGTVKKREDLLIICILQSDLHDYTGTRKRAVFASWYWHGLYGSDTSSF